MEEVNNLFHYLAHENSQKKKKGKKKDNYYKFTQETWKLRK